MSALNFFSFLFYNFWLTRWWRSFLFLPWRIWRWIRIVFLYRCLKFCVKSSWRLKRNIFNCAYIGMHFQRYFRATLLSYSLATNDQSKPVIDDIDKTSETIDISFLGVNKSPNLEHSDSVLHCIAALWSQSVLFPMLEKADFGGLASDCLYHQMLDFLLRCLQNYLVFY